MSNKAHRAKRHYVEGELEKIVNLACINIDAYMAGEDDESDRTKIRDYMDSIAHIAETIKIMVTHDSDYEFHSDEKPLLLPRDV